MRPPKISALSLVGFGEAAQAFAKGWRSVVPDLAIAAFDIKTANPAAAIADRKWQDFGRAGVMGTDGFAPLLAKVFVVVSLVTADQAHAAARAAARHIATGAFYFDGNSCAPTSKQAAAKVIDAAGGCYVDMAIMAPVHPKLHQTPILLSGPEAVAGAAQLTALGMSVEVVGDRVGQASSIKMIRSIAVKGLEALVAETVLAGRKAGVDDVVLASLEASYPGFGWQTRAAYNFERMMVHGHRRAAEMREVVKTITDLGLTGAVARATVDWQQRIGDLALAPGKDDYQNRAERILAALEMKGEAGQ